MSEKLKKWKEKYKKYPKGTVGKEVYEWLLRYEKADEVERKAMRIIATNERWVAEFKKEIIDDLESKD